MDEQNTHQKTIIGISEITVEPGRVIRIGLNTSLGDSISVEDAETICDKIVELSEGKPIIKLTVGAKKGSVFVENGVQKIFLKHEGMNRVTRAEALVIRNLSSRIVINFYSKMKARGKMIKTFNSEDKARKWLESLFDSTGK